MQKCTPELQASRAFGSFLEPLLSRSPPATKEADLVQWGDPTDGRGQHADGE